MSASATRPFPKDLLGNVAAYIEEFDTLLQYGFTSRSFRDAVLPYIFRTLVISKGEGITRSLSFDDVSRISGIVVRVKEIDYDASDVNIHAITGTVSTAFCCRVLNPCTVGDLLEELPLLVKFPNVHTLRIYFPSDLNAYREQGENAPTGLGQRFQSQLFETCGTLHTNKGFTLKFLEIHGLIPYPGEGLQDGSFKNFLRPLKGLGMSLLKVDADFHDSENDWQAFRKFTGQVVTILQVPTHLENLSYGGDTLFSGSQERWEQWKELRFPHLKFIHFKDLLLDDVTSDRQPSSSITLQFILRHKATLEELIMEGCTIGIDDSITWAEVFNVFEEELENLLYFTFSPLPGRKTGGTARSGYVQLDLDTGEIAETTHDDDDDDDEEEDNDEDYEALRAFQETLQKRQTEMQRGQD